MTETRVGPWTVVHWNPKRNTFPRPFRRLPVGKLVNNFGDLLGPRIVERIVADRGDAGRSAPAGRVLTVGSVLHMAQDGDIIWGSGKNGKVVEEEHKARTLDVRAVRGPLTARWLSDRGFDVPEVYGDPALLLPTLYPELTTLSTEKTRAQVLVPNLHDAAAWSHHPDMVSPIGPWRDVVEAIISSETVVASSLHGVIVAEAFGIPVAHVVSRTEPLFKFRDYYEGTGRSMPKLALTLDEALQSPPERDSHVLDGWSAQALLDAFPRT